VEAQARVEELRAYMAQEGITADRSIARGFAYEGYENLREGNYERAREAFDLARTFDPFLPQAQLGYAWSLLRAGRGVVTFINEYLRGVRLAWAQFTTDELQLSNFSAVAALAILCSLMVFTLVVIARCQGRARHDLYETARRFLSEEMARLFAWCVFLLPLLVWAGGLWLVLFWLALCFRYMKLPEKTVAACVFIMVALSPVGVAVVLDRFEASTDPEMRVVVSAIQAGYNPETVRRLQGVVRAHDEETELHILLGNAYLEGDLLGEAYDEYQHVTRSNASDTSALVNTGNVYYRLGEFGQAVNQYKQAIAVQPDLASAYWNLYLAQTELLHFAEADQSLSMARDLDSDRIGRLLARKKSANGPALLVNQGADLARIKRGLRSGSIVPSEQAHALLNPLSLASGAALVFALLLGIGTAGTLAQACTRCGRAHCPRCRVDAASGGHCARCVSLFVKKDGITGEVRREELSRLRRRDTATNIVRRLLTVVLPGSGHIMADRLLIGFTLMTGWVCAGIYLLTHERLLLAARVPVSDLPQPGHSGDAWLGIPPGNEN